MKRNREYDVCGVYCITNIVNGKLYIGSSNNIASRWTRHHNRLLLNKHHNKHLQNAWNVCGEINFFFSIVCETELKDTKKTEQYYLDCIFKTQPKILYNIRKDTGNVQSNNSSEKTKKLLSEIKKKLWKDTEYRNKMTMAFEKRGKNPYWREGISNAKKSVGQWVGKNNPLYGKSIYKLWVEKYGKEDADKKMKEVTVKNKLANSGKNNAMYGVIRPKVGELNKKLKSKSVMRYDENNKLIDEWSSISEASRILGLNKRSLANFITNKRNYACGFIWKYK